MFGMVNAQGDDLTASLRVDSPLYAGNAVYYPTMGALSASTAVTIDGRDDIAQWVLVSVDDARGWIPTGVIRLDEGTNLLDVPISNEVFAEPIPPLTPAMDLTDNADWLAWMERLMSTPILLNMDTDIVAEIYATGQTMGNQAGVFTRVGDSDTTTGGYLRPIGMNDGEFCELGAYGYLQETIDFYGESPLPNVPNSFDTTSLAAINGLTTVGVFDPFWADADLCESGEAPLNCEYRMVRPSVAVMMLGRMDVAYYEVDFYRENVRQLIEESMAQGVIPILTTFVVLPDNPVYENSLTFNTVLVDMAMAYDVPLINLWRAVQNLPRYGIGADFTHLSQAVGEFCTFTGSELQLGGTLRNLLTLQALDAIRRGVMVIE